ncbi:hypothetical protein BC937DRAFT_90944 [Endogone sp. FLAS-F59071]|nr:hypothetical protein BC937DRAFT_90944 [Endogone sp. FLAS-F59071]|eukprot:RUS16665.1 hypothetical protein BC937DRAFT_90944 [Endogone sp. FLAS-F59071]
MPLRTARTSLRASVPIAVSPWRHHVSRSLPPALVSRAPGLLSVEAPRVLHVPGRPFGFQPTHPKPDLNFEELEALIAQSHSLSEKSSFEAGLKASEADFEKIYGFKKPSKDEQVIFYCKSGRRSTIATELARSQGYAGLVHGYSVKIDMSRTVLAVSNCVGSLTMDYSWYVIERLLLFFIVQGIILEAGLITLQRRKSNPDRTVWSRYLW